MTALLLSLVILVLVAMLFRLLISIPLVRTLSAAIDTWADSVQGQDAREPR